MDGSDKLNLADAFISDSTCSVMFEQLERELDGLDISVVLLVLEGINRIGKQNFKLSDSVRENFKNLLRKWRCDSPLREPYANEGVSKILQSLTILKLLDIPLCDGYSDSVHERTLRDYGQDCEDIDIDGNTLLYYYAQSSKDRDGAKTMDVSVSDSKSRSSNSSSLYAEKIAHDVKINIDKRVSRKAMGVNKNCIDLVGAFISPEGCKMFFEQLTYELSNVNETVGLLALEGLFRLDKDIGELCDTQVKRLLRVGKWILFAEGVRKLLHKWVCNFPTGSLPEMWWRLRYCLLVYRVLEVPMFVDYLFKVNIKGLRSFADNQLEEIVVDGETPIFHITHRAEAWSILEQNRFRASSRKNAVEGTWFSPGKKVSSIYGSKCFETRLSLLGVTGLYQGEIVYYKDERNVILYATDDPGVNFKGLVKPTELFVKEEASTLPVNKDRQARPFVHVSIFVPARFLPDPWTFHQVVRQTKDVCHKPFCIRVNRRYRNDCDELSLCLPPSFHSSPAYSRILRSSAFDSGLHPCPYPILSTPFNQPFPFLPLHFPQNPHPNPQFFHYFSPRPLITSSSSPINFSSHHFPQPSHSQMPQRQNPLPTPCSLRNQSSEEATGKQKKKKRKKKKKINTNES